MSESPDTEYTPTTSEVRYAYGDSRCPDADGSHDLGCPADADFDRWLAAHDREVTAKALEDAAGNLAGAGWAKAARDWLRARAAHIREGEQ